MQKTSGFSQNATTLRKPIRVLGHGQRRKVFPKYIAITHSDLELYHAGEYHASQGNQQQRAPEPLNTWTIIYFRSGHAECVVNDEVYEAYPGTVILTPPGASHAEYAYTNYENICITLGASSTRCDFPTPPDAAPLENATANERSWPRVCLDDIHCTLKHLMLSIVREFHREDLFQTEILSASLTQLDWLLQRAQQQPPQTQARSEIERLVLEAEAIMSERYAQHLTVTVIAREIGVSATSLHAYFLRQRSRTPLDFLLRVRLEHAIALIQNSDLPLESVAVRCGYHSASHLGLHVKRATGKTPGSLRDS